MTNARCKSINSAIEKWLQMCQKLNFYMEIFFQKFSRLVTNNYKFFLVTSFLISAGLSAGFFRFNQLHQSARLYFPENSQAWDELDKTEETFSNYVGFFDFIITKFDGGNVIEDEILRLALDVHKSIINVSIDGKSNSLKRFCIKVSNNCTFFSVLSLFKFNKSEIVNSSVQLKNFYENKQLLLENGRNLQMSAFELFGNLQLGDDRLNADAVRFIYPIEFAKTDALYQRNKAIERKLDNIFQSHRNKAAERGFLLDYRTEKSNDDAIDENSSKIALVVIAITVMIALCSTLTLNIRKPVNGHLLLSLFGVLSVALGIGAAFGFVMLIGEPYVAFVGVLPFLVLAVGVDDMFIIMDEVDSINSTIVGNDRLINAVKRVGASITMTSLTDLVAFAVTANSDLSSVRYFCLYAALSIAFTYMMILTFFVSCFVLDIRRAEHNRCDIVPCVTANIKSKALWIDRSASLGEKLMERYAEILLRTKTKTIVVILYIGLVSSAGYAASKVNIGFDQKEIAADGSHELSWYATLEKYFPNVLWTSNVILQDKSFNYTKDSSIDLFLDIDIFIEKSEHFKPESYSWASAFNAWMKKKNKTLKSKEFYQHLRLFLLENPFFLADIKFSQGSHEFLNAGNGIITACRIVVIAEDNPLWQFHQNGMNNLRKVLLKINKEKNTNLIGVSLSWIYLELLNLVIIDVTKNLCICAIIIMVITLPYFWNPVISLVTLAMFGSIIVMLIAVMYMWSVDLSGVTLIIIIMSIGFAVDYMAHIAHTYVLSDEDIAETRMVYALKTTGRSVLKGGLSTFVGVLVTAFSKSKLFQIFFKMMFGIVGLGLIHGVVFLPVFLTIFARSKLNVSKEIQISSAQTDIVLSNSSTSNTEKPSVTDDPSEELYEAYSPRKENASLSLQEHSSNVILNKNAVRMNEKVKVG